MPKILDPMIGTIQWTDEYVVHANMNNPMGTRIAPAIEGGSLYSGSLPPISPVASSRCLINRW